MCTYLITPLYEFCGLIKSTLNGSFFVILSEERSLHDTNTFGVIVPSIASDLWHFLHRYRPSLSKVSGLSKSSSDTKNIWFLQKLTF